MLILPIASGHFSIPAWVPLVFLLFCGAWFAATVYGTVIFFHGLRDRDRGDTIRGAIWLFTPYVGLAALALLVGGLGALTGFVASYVTWVYVAIVVGAAVGAGLSSSPPPGGADGSGEGYNQVRRML